MKLSQDSTIVPMPREAGVANDDRYLVEMTERIQRLRSLMGEQERPAKGRMRLFRKPRFSGYL